MPCIPLVRQNYCRVAKVAFDQFESPEDFEINLVGGIVAPQNEDKLDSEKAEEVQMHERGEAFVFGYKRHPILNFLTWVLVVCTAGLLRLVFHWNPRWMLQATHFRCSLRDADKVLIQEKYQKHVVYRVKPIKELTAESAIESSDDGVPMVGASTLPLHVGRGVFKDVKSVRMFTFKKLQYIWDDEKRQFRKLLGMDGGVSTAALHVQTGLSACQQALRRVMYGPNDISVPITPISTLFFLEVLNPFYIFQIFSVCLWMADEYYYYGVAIFLLSAFGITASIIQTRHNQKKLQQTVHSVDIVTVVREDSKAHESITTDQLVPGDIIVVPPHGCTMHCDAVLLTGNCIVNESMLTGESVPITKTPLPNVQSIMYDSKEHARHTLFSGTHVIQTRYYGDQHVYALVMRTGFSTSKGDLVRSIMYPPPVDFKFEQDSYKFVELLACIASFGFIYTIITKHLRGVSPSEIALEALDLITIVVPPALPAAMTVGRMYAQMRLKMNGIYCTSPRSINVSGSVDCVCFDKTGTLTEDGLDMWGVVPVTTDAQWEHPIRDMSNLKPSSLLSGMVTCHSLTIIDSELSGDPLDLKMFECTNYVLEEPDVNDNAKFDLVYPSIVRPQNSPSELMSVEIGIVRQFPFSSSLQRMSVITKTLEDKEFIVYCKGSPEMILSLCTPETVPNNYNSVLEEYTEEGYRVIAMAWKGLGKLSYPKVQRMQREEVEEGLTFLGFIVLENKLKPETRGIIKELKQAGIATIMVTGDNMLTAVSVARDCGIVPMGKRVVTVNCTPASTGSGPNLTFSNHSSPVHLSGSTTNGDISLATNSTSVISLDTLEAGSISDLEFSPTHQTKRVNDYVFAVPGSSWELLRKNYPELISRIVTRGAVFARMSPDQKQDLILELQSLGYYVAMCGDGANDCGALKAAHAGISLSDAESSVASPFTSRQTNISCVPTVIREGRAALSTSFGIFKYMAAYSLTQFISVMILYSIDTNLSDLEFLFIDLFIITTTAFFFGRTASFQGELSPRAPPTSLVSLAPVLSLFFQLILIIIGQAAAFFIVQEQEWYVPFHEIRNISSIDSEKACYENYSVFAVSAYQYIILAVIFSQGKPYRKPLYSNNGLMISVLVLIAFITYLILYPAQFLIQIFELELPPSMGFRSFLLLFPFVHFIVAYLIEHFIVEILISKILRTKFHNIHKSKKKYLSVEDKLRSDYNWPVLSGTDIKAKTKSWTQQETRTVPSKLTLSPSSLLEQTEKALTNGKAGTVNLPS